MKFFIVKGHSAYRDPIIKYFLSEKKAQIFKRQLIDAAAVLGGMIHVYITEETAE